MPVEYIHICARCKQEERSKFQERPDTWNSVRLPTGPDTQWENWTLCKDCTGMYKELYKEHVGQMRAFVVGRSSGDE